MSARNRWITLSGLAMILLVVFSQSSRAAAQESDPPGGVIKIMPGPNEPISFPIAPQEPPAGQTIRPEPAQAVQAGNWSFLTFQAYIVNHWEIYAVYDDQNTATRLTDNNHNDLYPRFDPGGAKIVYISREDGRQYDVYTINPDGSQILRLTETNDSDETTPEWSPAGDSIIYSAYLNDNWDLWLMARDGTGERELRQDAAANDVYPAWSPDGTRIAWTRFDAAGGAIWVMNADGSDAHPITPVLPYIQRADWSPDGARLAFDADLDGDGWNEIGLVNPDGSNLVIAFNSPNNQQDYWLGSWAYNGQAIYFNIVNYSLYQGTYYINNASPAYRFLSSTDIFVPIHVSDYDYYPDYLVTDHTPPQLWLAKYPEYTPLGSDQTLQVSWYESDSGGSGIGYQEIWVENLITGTRVPGLRGLVGDGSPGQRSQDLQPLYTGEKIRVQMRLRDRAYNWTDWSETATHLYMHRLTGLVLDNRGVALPEVPISVEYELNQPRTSGAGIYEAYLESNSFAITIDYPGYQTWWDSDDRFQVSQDTVFDIWMRPIDDLILGGDFPSYSYTDYWTVTPEVRVLRDPRPLRSAEVGSAHFGNDCTLPICLTAGEVLTNTTGVPESFFVDSAIDSTGVMHLIQASAIEEMGVYKLNLSHSQKLPGGSWSTLMTIPGTFDRYKGNALFEIDAADNLHLIWRDKDDDIYHSQRNSNSGAWLQPEVVSDDSIPVALDIDSLGNIHLFYEKYKTYYVEKEAVSNQWSSPVEILGGSGGGTALCIGPDNTVYFLYPGLDEVFLRTRAANGVWSDPGNRLVTYGGEKMVCVFDNQNTLHLLKYDSSYSGDIGHFMLPISGVWSPINRFGYSTAPVYELDLTILDNQLYLFAIEDHKLELWTSPVEPNWKILARTGSPIWYPKNIDLEVDQNHIPHMFIASPGTYYTERPPAQEAVYSISQPVTITADLHEPTLSFFSSLFALADLGTTSFSVSIDDGMTVTPTYQTSARHDWAHTWIDMSPWSGQTVTVTFALQQAAGEPYAGAYVDDVSLGPWVTPVIYAVSPGAIPNFWASQVITVTGENFASGLIARVGDAPVPAVFVDETTVVVTLPAGLPPGKHDIWVTNPDGRKAALSNGLRLGYLASIPVIVK